MTRVFSDEVLYIGWNAYGIALQLVPVGSYWICANPFEGLAVIDPDWWVERSSICARSPSGVSCIETCRRSPEFMNRSRLGSGVYVASVESSGFAGACATPFLVTNAKSNVS